MKTLITRSFLALVAFAAPAFAQAQVLTDADSVIALATRIGNALIPIFISIAVIYLVYAIVFYIIAGDEDKKEEGKKKVVWGVIGLFLILSIWGLVNILRRTFVTNSSVPTNDFPQVVIPPRVN